MSTEQDKLQADQTQLWHLFGLKSDDSDVRSEIYELIMQIVMGYSDLIDKDESAEDSYAYLRFCLRYIEGDHDNAIGNIEYEICNTWRNVVEEDNFPALLEEDLLTLIEEKKISNVFDVEKMANKFTANEKYPKAICYFQAIGEQISNFTTWNNWAHCYAVQGDLTNAIEVLTTGMKNHPDSALLACNRAYYFHVDKKNTQSLDELQTYIERAEIGKYTDDHFYIYALKLKASIYRELNMPLQALIEYSRLSAAGHCDPKFLKENAEIMIPQMEALTYG